MKIAILLNILRIYLPPEEETNAVQEPMEEEIVETGSSLDENEKESDKQEEEEWSGYPFLPSNESNSLAHTLFDCPPSLQNENECYDLIDSFETSLFDKNDLVIYDNPCYIDKSYDNPLFVPTIEIHVNEELGLESLYDNAQIGRAHV